uniref:Uncharacterized protein n=1 Tax=Candidatus Kentrum sp. LPFa TaxID=2126335 RepID=A0A450XCY6_9GAMM|nr:MAG: hypothetical protein BECKLPF1236A_GA0070988_1004012 [Candidatus Kentron sp. LPFa]VFK27155.1 MAG: hypothetical protein BECKLPF1236C_GA0070990_1004312 [Candidatus Kentron sp. LPFa]
MGKVSIAPDGAIRINTTDAFDKDAVGVGFDSKTSDNGGSTAHVNTFANEGAITVTPHADSDAYASGVDCLALAEKSGDANLQQSAR